jgi:hypothetical protein
VRGNVPVGQRQPQVVQSRPRYPERGVLPGEVPLHPVAHVRRGQRAQRDLANGGQAEPRGAVQLAQQGCRGRCRHLSALGAQHVSLDGEPVQRQIGQGPAHRMEERRHPVGRAGRDELRGREVHGRVDVDGHPADRGHRHVLDQVGQATSDERLVAASHAENEARRERRRPVDHDRRDAVDAAQLHRRRLDGRHGAEGSPLREGGRACACDPRWHVGASPVGCQRRRSRHARRDGPSDDARPPGRDVHRSGPPPARSLPGSGPPRSGRSTPAPRAVSDVTARCGRPMRHSWIANRGLLRTVCGQLAGRRGDDHARRGRIRTSAACRGVRHQGLEPRTR